MKISLELEQAWATTKELLDYVGKIERTLQRLCEMEAESPTDWFFLIEATEGEEEHTITLTHL